MNRRTLLSMMGVTAAAAVMAGCASQDAPMEAAEVSAPTDYLLGTGDALRIIVFGEEQLSGEFRVDASGRVAMPLIGEVEAKGRTSRELEMEITKRLTAGYVRDARVSVEVMNHRPFFILGEVRNPGQYQYVNGMTAMAAVAMAGGFSYRAREEYVLITRGNDPQKQLRRAPITTTILPDDVIRVPERYF